MGSEWDLLEMYLTSAENFGKINSLFELGVR